MKQIFRIASILALGALAVTATNGMANAKDKVTVGYIGPITGKVSAHGIAGRNSADLAINLRNQDPNSKYEYELVALDDECKPNIGIQVATKMATDKHVSGAVTHFCSAVATGAVRIYHQFHLPVVVWGAISPSVTYGNDYKEIHRTIGTLTSQNKVAVDFLTGLGYKKYVVIYDTTDYGKGHLEAFANDLLATDGELLEAYGVAADQQDFTAELTKAKSLNPEVIYFAGLSDLGIRVRNQMEKLGIEAQFAGVSGIISDTFIDGTTASEGSLAMRQGAPVEVMPGGPEFIKKYADADYKDPAEAYGVYAYAAMNVLLDAVEEAGPDRQAITKALNTMPAKEYSIGMVEFDDHGQNVNSLVTPLVVQDGAWVTWDESEYASGKRTLKGK
ncbi:branched-chain amino acid ABC transporter substrate-binding protein [Sneathiella sp.]|uniref:branched-chain amino acid ABC transporter substrate-binding protein n=1 Tax=Sneathiella sp. TaxID=1964365 RepID=UPI00260822F2|nr:branched-chain amino acid ABC transporter substrate-binding protein [Sneathiella sp.]MDF2365652.1 branched-chain amino acid ABC transporter substrate-binding protein [Sneathiella sp.]